MHSSNISVSAFAHIYPAVIYIHDVMGPRPALAQKIPPVIFFNFFSLLFVPNK